MRPGDTVQSAGYTITFDTIRPERGPNFVADTARFTLTKPDGASAGELTSSKRVYTARRMPTTEAGIRTFGFSQLYLSLGDLSEGGGAVVRIWYKPLVTLIWLGALLMTIGGFVSLSDRRLRVGAPALPGRGGRARRWRRPDAAAAAPSFSLCASPSAGACAGGAARRGAGRSGSRITGARHLIGPSLPRLPEPVDRFVRCGDCPRLARPRSRAAEGGRERRSGDRLHRLALRSVRAAQAGLLADDAPALGDSRPCPRSRSAFVFLRRRTRPAEAESVGASPLSAEEEARLSDVLSETGSKVTAKVRRSPTLRRFHAPEIAL